MSFFRGGRLNVTERSSEVALMVLGLGTVGLLGATEMARRSGEFDRFRAEMDADRRRMAERLDNAFAGRLPAREQPAPGADTSAASGTTQTNQKAVESDRPVETFIDRFERIRELSQRSKRESQSRRLMAESVQVPPPKYGNTHDEVAGGKKE